MGPFKNQKKDKIKSESIFIRSKRNDDLRKAILESFVSQMMTDDERAKLLGLPEGCRMREGAKIISPENFACGKYVWIGEGAIIDASGGLTIGNHTSVGLNVMVWSHSSFLANLTLNNVIGNPNIIRKKTKIGKGCFISGPSVIYPGVTIGDQCIILPMSVVTKDVPSRSLVHGSPAIVKSKITNRFIREQIRLAKKANQS